MVREEMITKVKPWVLQAGELAAWMRAAAKAVDPEALPGLVALAAMLAAAVELRQARATLGQARLLWRLVREAAREAP